MLSIISLFKHLRRQLLLLLSVRVNLGGALIDHLGPACLRGPIRCGALRTALSIAVKLCRLALKVATSKDRRLELLILLLLSVDLLVRLGIRSHGLCGLGVLPVGFRRH